MSLNSFNFSKYDNILHFNKFWISNSLSDFQFETSSSFSSSLECSAVLVSPSHCQQLYKSSSKMVIKARPDSAPIEGESPNWNIVRIK